MAFALFCPQCDSLLLAGGECATCGWQRPRISARPGGLGGEPVPIGRPLSGTPALFEDVIWYAAPATSPDLPGALVALHRGGALVRRHELDSLLGRQGQPVAHGVAGDGRFLYPGLTDYAFGDERPPKSILALEPHSGRVAWQIPTPSRELSTPVALDGVLYATGSSASGVYAVDVGAPRLLWRSSVEADHRFQPAVAGDTVAVLAGTLTGDRSLVGLARPGGLLLWQVEVGPSAGQPLGQGGLIVVPRRQQLEAYDAASGHLRWTYGEARETSRGLTTAPLLAAGELLLAPVGDWEGEARAYALHALDVATGRRRWAYRWPGAGGRIKVTPALFGHTVLVGNSAGELFALELETGALLWQVTLPRRLAAGPVQQDDMLLLPGRDGQLLRLRWREEPDRPEEAAAVYEEAGDWEQAAAAHVLAEPADWSAAGRALLRAGQAEHALVIFRAGDDDAGAAEALAALGRLDEAVARFREAGQPAAAADILEAHELWDEALALRRQEGNWARVREISQQTGDWEGEAEACLQLAEAQPRREVRVPVAGDAPEGGLPQGLHERLREAFLICEAFSSDQALDAVFVDARIVPWRRQLRDAPSDLERVEAAIALLVAQRDRDGRNGLALLARVLGERTDENDALHGALLALAGELEAALAPRPATRVELVESKAARQWRVHAGDIYAAHERWPEAEACYQTAGHTLRWAGAVARQGRWEEAAGLLAGQRIAFDQAANYYWEAAAEALAGAPAWERRAPAAAALFEKAQECFLFSGNLEGFLLARTEADHCLLRPRLVLGEGELLGELQQGVTSQVTLPLYNMGFGPASAIEIFAYGSALKRPREQAVWAGSAPLVAAGADKPVEIAIEPVAAGQEEVPLQVKLLLHYRDVRNGLDGEDGPFELHQPVLPATAQAQPGKKSPVRPHHQGYYFDTREQVEIIRAARDVMHGERDVLAVLEGIPQSRPAGPDPLEEVADG